MFTATSLQSIAFVNFVKFFRTVTVLWYDFVSSGKITLFSFYSGSAVNVQVTLEREDELAGPVVAPLFPQVIYFYTCSIYWSCVYSS
jgi:hypothetical protein